jgi:hypothetical protein
VVSAGPNLPQAGTHLVEGKFGTPQVTLELSTPRGERSLEIHAAANVLSGNPPRPDVKYQIDASTDGGKTWQPVVKDWMVPRRGEEPKDFWSQSFCWGALLLDQTETTRVRVRFRNSGGKAYARCEAQLIYRTGSADSTRVRFAWTDDRGKRDASHTFNVTEKGAAAWTVPTGRGVQTRWVEFEPVATR